MDESRMVPRLEDLPYSSSPPIQFVYQSTANLALGAYTWADAATVMVPNRPIRDNVLYYFRHITFSADIAEVDFTGNIVITPVFQSYRQSAGRVMIFREPVRMVSFLQSFDYRLTWLTPAGQDHVLGSFNGQINQGPGLIGKNRITLTAVIAAQEIVDENYITTFRKSYPVESHL